MCGKCYWMKVPHPGIHCYMFRDPPKEGCAQYREKAEDKPKSKPLLVLAGLLHSLNGNKL
jgi:hypothetical protein